MYSVLSCVLAALLTLGVRGQASLPGASCTNVTFIDTPDDVLVSAFCVAFNTVDANWNSPVVHTFASLNACVQAVFPFGILLCQAK